MAPLPVPTSVAKQAEQLKQDGNSYFKKERLGAAIDAYTEAYYMLGLALLEKHDYSGGIKELEKALELGRGANPASYMVEEIWQVLSTAKYMEWEDSSRKRASRLQNLREVCEKALIDYYLIDASEAEDSSRENDHFQQSEYLHEVFDKAAQADTPSEVPDHLCCKITLDIFRDPVITPSGITYERAVLLDHLQRVGKFDPVTREPLEPHQLVPNLAIKEAVQAFLSDHGWAYKGPDQAPPRITSNVKHNLQFLRLWRGLDTAVPVLLVDGYNVCGYWAKLKKHFMKGRLDIARQKLIDELMEFSVLKGDKVLFHHLQQKPSYSCCGYLKF
ncbi:putative E3 ubiquitin-protein ligase CHIP [Cocos nucifera]|uniref:E3 ubiquitin-protein ligase CHIP n=1 Tax=Cocos nucifera TaxID=13894 RepID=A0A8K0HXP6_COCNU|nr:putative E3 ubiquitin-protein ligase CHIP [Cocos nucifera]